VAKVKSNKLFRYLEYKVLHIDDTPHKIALGLALGLFIGWTPLIGLHILLAIVFSTLLRANKFAAFVSIWISNVFTFFIIYYPAYLFGSFLFNIFAPGRALSHQQVTDALNKLLSPGNMLTEFLTKEYWQHFWTLSKTIGPELWIGCTVIGTVVAVCAYFACIKIIKSHRAKNPHRRYRKY
jgi:uncharacterized protein (DUF2062 family)